MDSTKKMINADAFAKMKDGVIVLNFARDLLVDDDALEAAIAAGRSESISQISRMQRQLR